MPIAGIRCDSRRDRAAALSGLMITRAVCGAMQATAPSRRTESVPTQRQRAASTGVPDRLELDHVRDDRRSVTSTANGTPCRQKEPLVKRKIVLSSARSRYLLISTPTPRRRNRMGLTRPKCSMRWLRASPSNPAGTKSKSSPNSDARYAGRRHFLGRNRARRCRTRLGDVLTQLNNAASYCGQFEQLTSAVNTASLNILQVWTTNSVSRPSSSRRFGVITISGSHCGPSEASSNCCEMVIRIGWGMMHGNGSNSSSTALPECRG